MPTFYVSPSGNDGNAGTSIGLAWKTLTPVNARTYLPGDTVFFEGGQTFTGGIYIHNVASTSASPVTLDSYGTGKATISTAAGTVGCYIYQMGGMVIQNLNFTGPGVATANRDGVSFYNDAASTVYPYIRITNCTIVGYLSGISIGGGAGTSGYSDVRIQGCDCHANAKNGIIMFGAANYSIANVYVGSCSTYNNTGIAGQSAPTGSGIQLSSINAGTVEYCSSYGNGVSNNFSQGPVGIWCYESTGVTIQSCESYNNLSSGGDGDGFDLDGGCTNCIIQYCYSHGNKGAGFCMFQYAGASTFSGNVIRYCISESDKAGGFALWGANTSSKITNSQIYNNTVFSSLAPALDINSSNMTGMTATNNIFLTTGGVALVDYAGTTGITFAKNNYYPLSGAFLIWWGGVSYASLASWGQDSSGLSVDPLLVLPGIGGTVGNAANLPTLASYKISSANSPMVNAGTIVTSPGARDFWGGSLFAGAPDIGANEFYLAIGPLLVSSQIRTVTFKSVLDGVATRMGLEPSANFQLSQAAALTEYITDRIGQAWEIASWPEWTTSERRQFRANWDTAVTYAVGAEVYDPTSNAYYRSLQAANTGNAVTSTLWWTPATDLATYVAFEQAWETNKIGEVWAVYLDDPHVIDRPRLCSWWIGPEGIWVQTTATKVWVEFSLRPPIFTTVPWDAAVAYAAGDLVYYAPDCYVAATASTNAVPSSSGSWIKQSFPYVLSRAVKLVAIADALREDQSLDKATAWDAQSGQALMEALDRARPAYRTADTFTANGR